MGKVHRLTVSHQTWLFMAVAVVLVAALVGGLHLTLGAGGDKASTWDSYEEAPEGLVVVKTVRSCDELVGVRAHETARRVEVAVEVDFGGVCGHLAVDKAIAVELTEPLGVREVYDAACLEDQGRGRAGRDCARSPLE